MNTQSTRLVSPRSNPLQGLDQTQSRMLAEHARAAYLAEVLGPLRRWVGGRSVALSSALRNWLAVSRTRRELQRLDTRMLSDIGLERADIADAARGVARASFVGQRGLRPIAASLSMNAKVPGAVNDHDADVRAA